MSATIETRNQWEDIERKDAVIRDLRAKNERLLKALKRIAAVEVRVEDARSAPGRYLKACRACARAAVSETLEDHATHT